jgi:hypothetical protein
MYGGMRAAGLKEAEQKQQVQPASRVERVVVKPAQAEEVEYVLRLTPAQASKILALTGRVVGRDSDCREIWQALDKEVESAQFSGNPQVVHFKD